MHRVTINVPENLYVQLRARAKQNDHSLQEELLMMLRLAYSHGAAPGATVQPVAREPSQKSSRPQAAPQKRSLKMRPLETLRKRWSNSSPKKKSKAAKPTRLGDLVRTIGRERKTGMKKLLKKIRRRG